MVIDITKKCIMKEDRVILIKNELTNEQTWIDLFDSLTFAEGLAMSNAVNKWASRFMKIEEKESD